MSGCNHLWQPHADSKRIWQKCVECGEEQHVTTHEDALMSSLAYILRDAPPPSSAGDAE